MRSYIAALYSSSGRVVTGHNHGEAFGKLNEDEKNGDICSGFLDSDGRFLTEDCKFFAKHAYLIRHGECEEKYDAPLCDRGAEQICKLARHLASLELNDFNGIVSPYRRCLQTAKIISDETGIQFSIECDVREKVQTREEVCALINEFPNFKWPEQSNWLFEPEDINQFFSRILNVLKKMPERVLIVSHSDFILNFSQEATGQDITKHESWNSTLPHGSMTVLKAKDILCIGSL